MLRKILIIAWKDTYLTFTDRTLLVMMLLTPLLLSTIIGLAFGGASGGTIEFSDIPVAIVNLDESIDQQGEPFSYGQLLVDIYTGSGSASDAAQTDASECDEIVGGGGDDSATEQTSLEDLFAVTLLDDWDEARAGVEDGTYAAAIFIPDDFSAQLAPQIGMGESSLGETQVDIYANEGLAVSASIVRSVTDSFMQQFLTGNVTVAATIAELLEQGMAGELAESGVVLVSNMNNDEAFDFDCAFVPSAGSIGIDQPPLDDVQRQSNFVQVLVGIGTAQAVFFALFTGQFGVLDVFEEQRQGTLQRMSVSPTPRSAILIGKILGVVLSVLLQIIVLMVSLTAVASLVEQTPTFIWGTNLPLLALLVVVIVLSVSGVGVLLAGLAQTPEQVNVIGPILNVTLAALGGAFGFTLPQTFAQFSPVYWAVDAYQELAAGGTDIGLNLLILLVQGGIMMVVGLWFFNRRVEV